MSRDEMIVVVRRQAGQLVTQDLQISDMAGQLAELMEATEALAGKLAKLEAWRPAQTRHSSIQPAASKLSLASTTGAIFHAFRSKRCSQE